jgi:integrase
MKITSAIVWDHRGRVPKGGLGQLEIRITINRRHHHFGTGIRVHKSEFLAGQIVNCHGAKELNERLGIIYKKVLACVNACVENGTEINTEEIRKKVWQLVESQSDEPTFINWIEQQIQMLGVSEGTAKHYDPLVTRLTEWGQMTRWQDVTVENVAGFDAWLHTITKPLSDARRKAGAKPEKLSDSGIYNYHKCLKALLNRAKSFQKIESNPYEYLRGKFKRGESENVEYLTDEEMRKFETMILPTGTELDVAHDLFTFQMYTGLSYTDMQAFDASDYKWDGHAWRNVGERIKTGVAYVSQLLPPAVMVLEKYHWEIPKMNNADYNHHLKALQAMAGIKTRLHSHLARHTFATWMLRNGASIENVSKMLGHTNITQTQRYAKVQAQAVYDDFNTVSEKIWKKRKENMENGREKKGKGG